MTVSRRLCAVIYTAGYKEASFMGWDGIIAIDGSAA